MEIGPSEVHESRRAKQWGRDVDLGQAEAMPKMEKRRMNVMIQLKKSAKSASAKKKAEAAKRSKELSKKPVVSKAEVAAAEAEEE